MQPTATDPSKLQKLPALFLMGPTASGKTELAIHLAKALNGEVISVDSALVYREMNIGTAKPDAAERKGIPHHLIDILDPAERYSTGQFRKDALRAMEEVMARGRLPILAGGTMLYFHGLTQGLSSLPRADPQIRARIDQEAKASGWAELHAELKRVDPEAGTRIHPNDSQRIQRALEVYRLTGTPMSRLIQENPPREFPFRSISMLLAPDDRRQHANRIERRFLEMIRKGLIDEVRRLFDRPDLHPDLPSIRAVGYRQIWSYLEGNISREEMIEQSVIATRQFAKRQMTWLRRESFDFRLESQTGNVCEKALGLISGALD